MNKFVTDTQALVIFMKGMKVFNSKIHQIFIDTDKGKNTIIIPALTLAEILYLFEKSRIPINIFDIEKIIQSKNYKKEGKSVKQIARYFKCSYRTIYRRLKRLNISLRPENRKKKPKVYLGKRQLEKILNETDWTIHQIAKKLRATPETVRKYIEKYEL